MRLLTKDQIHVSAVRADALRPHDEIEVTDAIGAELLAKHPTKFDRIDVKAEPAPQNKAEPDPINKAETKGKGKRA